MVAVDSAARLAQFIDDQNNFLSKLSQLFEDDKSTKVSVISQRCEANLYFNRYIRCFHFVIAIYFFAIICVSSLIFSFLRFTHLANCSVQMKRALNILSG